MILMDYSMEYFQTATNVKYVKIGLKSIEEITKRIKNISINEPLISFSSNHLDRKSNSTTHLFKDHRFNLTNNGIRQPIKIDVQHIVIDVYLTSVMILSLSSTSIDN